jgi:mycothiol synthase
MTTVLDPSVADDVRRLASRAARADGVAALSEQFLLDLSGPEGRARHVLSYAGLPGDGTLAGYAQLARDGSAELVVDPDRRRGGHGSRLLDALLAAEPRVRVWAHGDTDAARGFAGDRGLAAVRRLHRMSRRLGAEDDRAVDLPADFTVRAFVPDRDEDAWVEANAAAFADHPEQGSVDRAGLEERMRQPWFDPAGLLLVEDGRRAPGDPAVAAFHWTKVDPEQRSAVDPELPAGEVYVLGVHPAYQGRGLALPLTALGLAHLARRGLPEVILYVDGDNTAAIRTYERAGFTVSSTDVMYARADLA